MLQSILDAMAGALGHGGLTWLATAIGVTPSAARKRMRSKQGAFDAPTLRAALLAMRSKAELFTTDPAQSITAGAYTVDLHIIDGKTVPAWRKSK